MKNDAIYQQAQVYTSLQGLNRLKQSAQSDEQGALKQVAQQFESLFMQMMLKTMRDANEMFGQDSYFSSRETRFYQDMLDNQMSLEMGQGHGLGIADMLVRQMSRHTDTGTKVTEKPVDPVVAIPLERTRIGLDAPAGVVPSGRFPEAGSPEMPVPRIEAGGDAGEGEHMEPPLPMSPDDFVTQLYPHALDAAKSLGVDPYVLIAQAALETGWGKHMIEGSNNLFGIKAAGGWQGAQARAQTTEYEQNQPGEVNAAFRSYNSFEESFADYVNFLKSNPRYQTALQVSHDSEAFVQALQSAGYATDPHYADKILSLLSSEHLKGQSLI